MGKFSNDATELLAAIGGKENIVAVSHCITRMRFVLGDPAKADIRRIEAIPSVKGTFTQAGQFQVIIGNEVADFYNDFTEVSGVSGVSKAEVKSMSKQNQNLLQRLMTSIAEIFAPLIPAIVVGGLILGFRNVIDSMQIFNGATLVSQSQFWAGIDHFLWLLGEAVFHVGIPVGICWTIMKKMGGIRSMLNMLPGMSGKDIEIDENAMKKPEAIIRSMTKKERRNPEILNASRRRRIAAGSGTTVQDVNLLIRNFENARNMIKQFGGNKNKGKMRQLMRSMPH